MALLQSQNALTTGHNIETYSVNQVLSDDEFSITYQATDTEQNIEVIIKEYLPASLALRDHTNDDIITKTTDNEEDYEWGLSHYFDEGLELVDLNHPNVVNVRACIKAHNTVYVITDDINGIDLESYAEEKAHSEADVISLVTPLLDGLQAIHNKGYLHSDLTPSNILIQQHTNTPMIINLGDVKHIFRNRNQEIAHIISSGYSPYEQYHAHSKQGAWTDIYAMGGILYRIISGITPNSSMSRLAATVDNHGADPLTPASLIGKDRYSEQLLSAIDHAMQLKKADRPQSIRAWQEELGIIDMPKEKTPDTNTDNIASGNFLRVVDDEYSQSLEIDFNEINQPFTNSNKKHYRGIVTTLIAMLATFASGTYYYYKQPPNNYEFDDSSHYQETITTIEGLPIEFPELDPSLPITDITVDSEIRAGEATENSELKDTEETPNEDESKSSETIADSNESKKNEQPATEDSLVKKQANTSTLPTKRHKKENRDKTVKTKSKTTKKLHKATNKKPVKRTHQQPKKHVSRNAKTKEQYQREWEAEQRRKENREKWKKKKQQQKKEREKKSIKQIEEKLIGGDEW